MSERFLSRREAAQHLTERGLRTAERTLAKLACIGGGPDFRKYGRSTIYVIEDLDRWADARMGAARASTSQRAA